MERCLYRLSCVVPKRGFGLTVPHSRVFVHDLNMHTNQIPLAMDPGVSFCWGSEPRGHLCVDIQLSGHSRAVFKLRNTAPAIRMDTARTVKGCHISVKGVWCALQLCPHARIIPQAANDTPTVGIKFSHSSEDPFPCVVTLTSN